MRKTDKIVVCFFIFLACAYLVFVISSSEGLEDNIFEPVTPKKITDYTTNQFVQPLHDVSTAAFTAHQSILFSTISNYSIRNPERS